MNPTLVVMAAGMGSRYGGLKQIDPVGPRGEIVIDYSVYDALRAGFGRVVFIIRRDIEESFREVVEPHFRGRIPLDYAFQSLDDLPPGFSPPVGRQKPWGTAHAIRACRALIDGPFGVINADDYYGRDAFAALAHALQARRPEERRYVLVGYALANTLSEHGSVSRGVCDVQAGRLCHVTERTKIQRVAGVIQVETEAGVAALPDSTIVSMNMWGFTPALFPQLERAFVEFLVTQGGLPKSECYIPAVVDQLVARGEATVDVVDTSARWLGMTYTEDKPLVRAGIQALIDAGEYPARLWAD